MPRYKFSASLYSLFCGVFNTSAAGNLHSHNGNAFDVVERYDFRQLFRIVHAVQLGAAHEGDVSLDEPLMEGGVGVGGAVGGNQEPCAVKIRSVYPDRFQ